MTTAVSSNLGANQRLSDYAARVVARRAEGLAFYVERASRTTSEDAVHKLRVAARRLGSALDAFEEHFPSGGLAKVSKQAKHLRSGAGSVRDHDIALALAAEVGLELPDKARERVERGRESASEDLRRLLARLEGKSPGAEWARALGLTGKGRGNAAGPTAASYAAALLPRMANEFFEAGHEAAAPAATIESLHAFRILGKRFRYTLEIFAPCYGATLQDALGLLRGLQDILGLINDCETAGRILAKAVSRNQREQVETLLEQRQTALVESFRSHWNETFAAEGECLTWMQMLARPAFAPASETAAAKADQRAAAS
jgi:CHAD domain-containing protein